MATGLFYEALTGKSKNNYSRGLINNPSNKSKPGTSKEPKAQIVRSKFDCYFYGAGACTDVGNCAVITIFDASVNAQNSKSTTDYPVATAVLSFR